MKIAKTRLGGAALGLLLALTAGAQDQARPIGLAMAAGDTAVRLHSAEPGVLYAIIAGFDLAPFELPNGLQVQVAPQFLVSVGTTSDAGDALVPVDLANDSLAGIAIHFQAGVWARGSENPLPVALSNALTTHFSDTTTDGDGGGTGDGDGDGSGGTDSKTDQASDEVQVQLIADLGRIEATAHLLSTDSIPPHYAVQVEAIVPARGYVLTADHVAHDEGTVRVFFTLHEPAPTDALSGEELVRMGTELGTEVERVEVHIRLVREPAAGTDADRGNS